MEEILKKVFAFLGGTDDIDKKVNRGLTLLQKEIPQAKFIFEHEKYIDIARVVQSAYASGLANGYMDALINIKKEQK